MTLRLTWLYCLSLLAPASAALASEPIEFSRDVRLILSDKCYTCHGPDEKRREADLRLDTQAGLRQARMSKVLVPGKPEQSELFRRVASHDPEQQMPPPDSGKSLTPRELTTLRQWIAEGGQWKQHWAYAPLANPAQDRLSIDEHLLARIRQRGLELAPPADPATLLRRLSLDLIGLPPTPAEVERFLNDHSPRAYERTVDRLLASPHLGERLALFWLDLVRYADSVGYHKDSHRNVWLYRDWVIQAFNDNLPLDDFIVKQLAGDLLEGDKYDRYQWLAASGFNRMNQTTSEGGAQAKQYLAIYAADRVRNTASILFGSTLGCAECHDHKYDPFTTRDFYRLSAFFADLQERGVGFPQETRLPTRRQIEEMRELDAKLLDLERQAASAQGDQSQRDQELEELRQQRMQLDEPKTWVATIVSQSGKPRVVRVLPRGNWLDESGPIAQPAIPEFLGILDTGERRATRLDLARWIVGPDNPLTARVMVNRLWNLMFGQGLCRTLDDVGSQGQWPTHPQLLDQLAVEFRESGWDTKLLLKRIAMSEAYRRSSSPSADQRKLDPENNLLAHQNSFRLEAELVRDNALAISGILSRRLGGPSVKPYQPANYWFRLYKDAKYQQDHGENLYRRGVYTYWRRSFWHPSLQAFDAPSREECVAQRPRSNTPQQSLVLLNDPTYVEAARALAARMATRADDSSKQEGPEEAVALAYQLAAARRPCRSELDILTKLYHNHRQQYADDPAAAKALLGVGKLPVPNERDVAELAAWTSVARVILNLHETITRN